MARREEFAMRMLGPVFAYEWIAAARRRSTYFSRAGFLLLLLAALVFAYVQSLTQNSYPGAPQRSPLKEHAELGE